MDAQLRTALASLVVGFCRSSIGLWKELKIKGLVGVTVDQQEVTWVDINETLFYGGGVSNGGGPSNALQLLPHPSPQQTISQPLVGNVRPASTLIVPRRAALPPQRLNAGVGMVMPSPRMAPRQSRPRQNLTPQMQGRMIAGQRMMRCQVDLGRPRSDSVAVHPSRVQGTSALTHEVGKTMNLPAELLMYLEKSQRGTGAEMVSSDVQMSSGEFSAMENSALLENCNGGVGKSYVPQPSPKKLDVGNQKQKKGASQQSMSGEQGNPTVMQPEERNGECSKPRAASKMKQKLGKQKLGKGAGDLGQAGGSVGEAEIPDLGSAEGSGEDDQSAPVKKKQKIGSNGSESHMEMPVLEKEDEGSAMWSSFVAKPARKMKTPPSLKQAKQKTMNKKAKS